MMHYLAKACILVTLVVSGVPTVSAQLDTLSHDGLVRDYFVHLPASYDGSAPAPVVIAFHGGFGSAENIERQSGLSDVSEEEGFIAVYPNGTGTIQTWNGGECCGFAANENIDDVGFVDKLIDRLEERFNIAQGQVYATGISNGAAMSYRLACELSGRVTAIGPVAATYRNESCQPERSVPVIHFHSEADSNVPIGGGVGDGPSNLDWIPLDSTLANFAAINNCSFKDSTIISETLVATSWSGCDDGEAVKYFRTADGGHSWPGGTKTIIGDTVSTAVDASREMWRFFEQFANVPVSIDNPDQGVVYHLLTEVYPNPTSGPITLSLTSSQVTSVQIQVYDMLGREVLRRTSATVKTGGIKISLDTQRMPSGNYVVRVESTSGITSHLFSKK